MNETRICPKCNKPYTEPPALSRRDNKTFICSACGTKEALEDAINAGMVSKEYADKIVGLVEGKKV